MASLRLVVLTNPVAGREDDYNEWYSGRHLDDVLAVEGFHAAQRFELRPGRLTGEAPFRYLAIYEVEAASVEEAESRLLATASDERLMPISDALDPRRATWWFEPIGERRIAQEDRGQGK